MQETIKMERINMVARKSLPRRVAVAKPGAKRPSVSGLRKGGRLLKVAQKFFILKL